MYFYKDLAFLLIQAFFAACRRVANVIKFCSVCLRLLQLSLPTVKLHNPEAEPPDSDK